MSTISKTTYTFTVLHRTDQPPRDLHDALVEAEGGHAVGNETGENTVPVPASKVEGILQALGNDGSFFDDDLDEANEPPSLPLAHPADPQAIGTGVCGFCSRSIHRVIGGHGPTWVHDESGMKFCDKETT